MMATLLNLKNNNNSIFFLSYWEVILASELTQFGLGKAYEVFWSFIHSHLVECLTTFPFLPSLL